MQPQIIFLLQAAGGASAVEPYVFVYKGSTALPSLGIIAGMNVPNIPTSGFFLHPTQVVPMGVNVDIASLPNTGIALAAPRLSYSIVGHIDNRLPDTGNIGTPAVLSFALRARDPL